MSMGIPRNVAQLCYDEHIWWANYYIELITGKKPKDESENIL